jgi:F-type H+-transporting ATPase subunit a
MAGAMDPGHLIGHVKDSAEFHLPLGYHFELPEVLGFQITKFMVIEVFVAVMMVAVFVPLAWKVRSGRPVKGRFWNMLEVMVVFLRDEVARPAIGKAEADRFLPFLWTLFFFILGCNLLGLVPWAGSPTGSIAITGVLALSTFAVVVGAGTAKFGFWGFLKGQVPHMELPLLVGIPIKSLIFVLEVIGLLIRHGVLSVRLFANMMAGHLVLAVVLGFIALAATQHHVIWSGVMVSSVFGAVAVCLLELFVAFLQAYIFAFLSALFIGMVVHQH